MYSITGRKAAILLTLASVVACSKKAPPPPPPPPSNLPPPAPAPIGVGTVELGKRVGPDHRITEPTTTFGVRDTIYASVSTTGTGNASLTAKWSFETNQVVDSTTVTIAPTGPAVTEFHIIKPSGWPVGKYRVEVMLNGAKVADQYFDVKK